NILPHEIRNVAVFNNKLLRTGCEGIQAGCIVSGMKIYNNIVEQFGISPFADAQNNGIQIGEGSTGLLYNNIIKNGPGNGIIVLGSGNTKIYNNLVVNAGSYGAFIDNRGPASGDIAFINNTFINPKSGGLKTYNELVSNKFYNNIIAGTTTYFIYGSGAKGDEKNNLTKASVNDCGFVNPAAGDYRLKAGSPAIDKGMNVASYGIRNCLANKGRPSGAGYDIGAYEF
ncbi:MAG TPA: right-handed parallel beta-helix repeat-containing protein, partial [Cytophagaceae bacterium]